MPKQNINESLDPIKKNIFFLTKMKSKTNMQKSRIEKDLNEENEKMAARQEQ